MKINVDKMILMSALTFGSAVGFTSCSNEDSKDDEKSKMQVLDSADVTSVDKKLTLNLESLGDLGADYVYEGWIITSNGPVTSGRFSMNETKEKFEFNLASDIADDAKAFVLTIEPVLNDDAAPSMTHVLAGDIVDGVAVLSVEHNAAFGTNFATASGAYILETPTTGGIAEDYNQGIWFIDTENGPKAGLNLPVLPAGWAYEGWVVGENGPVSTGVFTDVNTGDFDGAGIAAGVDAFPPFPGQDFINPALNLVGQTVVISVEPSPDNSAAPFFMKPLIDMQVDQVDAAVPQAMENISAKTNAKGTVSLL